MTSKRGRSLILFAAVAVVAMAALCACGNEGEFLSGLESGYEGESPWKLAILLAVGTHISEDLACVSAGVLAGHGHISFWIATLACFIGIWAGDMGLYLLGRFGGRRLLSKGFLNWIIKEEKLEKGAHLFREHGGKIVVTSRFLPGTRLPIYLSAGLLRYSFLKFSLFMAGACLIWTPLLVFFSMKLGSVLLDWLGIYERAAAWGVVLVVVLVWISIKIVIPALSYRGRRLLYSKWLRLTEWEFWPMGLVYIPVALHILNLGRKYRSLTLFTLANPGIPEGGLAMESKYLILRGLVPDGGDDERVARFALISPDPESGGRLQALEAFMESRSLSFPIVLKPDVGERGQGVAVIHQPEDAEQYLAHCQHPVIAQEYVDGLEFGVFYYRYPSAPRGEILSITEKRMLHVTGDGRRNLERLILDDPRAVRMAAFFLERFDERRKEVPPAGERIRLTVLGTHCRGAVFLDGIAHLTPELSAAIDSLSHQFEGFNFGRYDLRVPSVEDLRAGRNFKVLELNGVSAESTHIYSPGRSIFLGYRDLFKQWDIAFEIGAQNRGRGHFEATPEEIWRLIQKHRTFDWYEVPPQWAH